MAHNHQVRVRLSAARHRCFGEGSWAKALLRLRYTDAEKLSSAKVSKRKVGVANWYTRPPEERKVLVRFQSLAPMRIRLSGRTPDSESGKRGSNP